MRSWLDRYCILDLVLVRGEVNENSYQINSIEFANYEWNGTIRSDPIRPDSSTPSNAWAMPVACRVTIASNYGCAQWNNTSQVNVTISVLNYRSRVKEEIVHLMCCTNQLTRHLGSEMNLVIRNKLHNEMLHTSGIDLNRSCATIEMRLANKKKTHPTHCEVNKHDAHFPCLTGK